MSCCRSFVAIRLAATLVVGLVLIALPAMGTAFAETPSGATTITLVVAKSARFGQDVHLSARLVDAVGQPISGTKVAFMVPDTFFLGTTGDVSIAEVLTSKEGVAEAEYQARSSGWLTFRAEFRGNDRYSATRANGRILIEDLPRQLYVQHAGVQVPGLNAPPGVHPADVETDLVEVAPSPSGLARLWPTLSAWPIALVLLIIWSLYAVAVRQMFHIASAASADTPPAWASRNREHRIVAGGSGGAVGQGGFHSRPRIGEGQ